MPTVQWKGKEPKHTHSLWSQGTFGTLSTAARWLPRGDEWGEH